VPHAWWFGEDQARYIVTVPQAELLGVLTKLKAVGVPFAQIGVTGGSTLGIGGETGVAVGDLDAAHERWLLAYMTARS
jgi:phosphoribosylformylglycinamidine synthase subunit PurL